jgi:hypothetical protein
MSFNESNTVEQMILDAVENLGRNSPPEFRRSGLGFFTIDSRESEK